MVLLSMHACRLYDGRCGPFIRELTVTGNTATPAQLFSQITLVEQRDGSTTTRIFSWLVQGASLRPGLVRVDLIDSQTGEVWANLPISTIAAENLAAGNSDASGWIVPWDDVRARIANGRGRVRLTYASPAPQILLPLTILRSTGFEQPHCS
jgi:hypothetical protein